MNSWVQHDNLSRETHKEKEFERRKKKDIKEEKKEAKRPFYPISSSFLFEESRMHRVTSIRNADFFFKELYKHTSFVPLFRRFKTFRVPVRRAFGILLPISHTFRSIRYGFLHSAEGLWMTSTTKAIQLRLALCRIIILTISSPSVLQNILDTKDRQTLFRRTVSYILS